LRSGLNCQFRGHTATKLIRVYRCLQRQRAVWK
jgi:hypothetical protein